MFDREKFGKIIKRINDTYPTQYEFADSSNVNRTYLSQYINMKLSSPPKPSILRKIANASKGITTYDELMGICGYIIDDDKVITPTNSLKEHSNFYTVPLFVNENGVLKMTKEDVMLPSDLDLSKQYYAFLSEDESMSPLLGINDIAVIEKTTTFEDNNTCLISLDNKIIMIRKILDLKTHIELQPINYNFDTIKLTKEDMKKRNFTILGKVVEAKNKSAF